MQQLQLYLNDQLVDLSDDSPIALSFQINNLAEVKNQQGNTSNQFKLPLTQRNRQILGYPDDVAFTNHLPYTQYAAKLVQDGLEIIPYGIGELNSIDDDTASMTILSGNVDFFDNIDFKIYDMGDSTSDWFKQTNLLPWKAFDHEWTLQNVIKSQTHEWQDGWIWPVVDYGKIATDFSGTPTIDVRYLRPGFYLRKAIELMVTASGYRINPDSFLVKEDLYDKLIVQFANDSFDHGTDYQNTPDSLSASVISKQRQYTGKQSGVVTFTEINAGYTLNSFSLANDTFTAKQNMHATITFTYNLGVRGTRNNKPGGMQMQLRHANATGDFSNLAYVDRGAYLANNVYAPYTNEKLSFELDLTAGDRIQAAFMPIYDKGSEAYIDNAQLTIINEKAKVIYSQTVQCERIFPDISQKDLLKDTLQRFGIICQTDNTTRMVTLSSLRDIVNNIPRAYDWTGKCLNQGKSISFQLGGYAQVNNLKYKQDDNVLPQTLADAQLLVNDKTLAATTDLFESQFAPTLNRPYIGGTIAQIMKVDTASDANATDFSIGTQPRILIWDKVDLLSLNRNINFVDGTGTSQLVNGTICTPYFDKTNGAYSLLFDKLRLAYYPELEKVLQRSKKVVRYFLLTPRDILELNLLIPVYLQQDGAYYYINKIDSWRKGQPTKVELVKLG